MRTRWIALALVVLFPLAAYAQPQPPAQYRVRNLLNDLVAASTEMSKEATRNAEVLRRLIDAGRALDDWQKNTAVAKALDEIRKAEQLAAQAPFNPRVQRIVRAARELVGPAQDSPMNADLPKIRQELRGRCVDGMRQIVAEDIGALARITSQLTEVTNVVARSMAASSAAALGQSE